MANGPKVNVSSTHTCPNCGEMMVDSEAALNRSFFNAIFFGFGSSILQIRTPKGNWMDFMTPGRKSGASYCTSCGAVLLAPSIDSHRKELGLDS